MKRTDLSLELPERVLDVEDGLEDRRLQHRHQDKDWGKEQTCRLSSLSESWMLRTDWKTGDSSTDIRVFRSSFT
jgi:hypothetical protein